MFFKIVQFKDLKTLICSYTKRGMPNTTMTLFEHIGLLSTGSKQFKVEVEKKLGRVDESDKNHFKEMKKDEASMLTGHVVKSYNGSLGHENDMHVHFVGNQDF